MRFDSNFDPTLESHIKYLQEIVNWDFRFGIYEMLNNNPWGGKTETELNLVMCLTLLEVKYARAVLNGKAWII